MKNILSSQTFFDDDFPLEEQFPRQFDVNFREISDGKVIITVNNDKVGNLLTDNSYQDDGYRFHDIFHLSYAAVLGWSPCVRKMLNKKRKSNSKVDEVEDGARAIITEEAISLLVFNHAKMNNFFTDVNSVDLFLLKTIVQLSANFESKGCSLLQWEKAILKGYSVFRSLIQNKGGLVRVDLLNQDLFYSSN